MLLSVCLPISPSRGQCWAEGPLLEITGGEVTECVSMKYSFLLLHFLLVLVHVLVLTNSISRPLNTHHGQQQIHETAPNPNKNSEHVLSYSTQKVWGLFNKTKSLCEHTEAVGSTSVEVVALALSLFHVCASKFNEKKSTCVFYPQVESFT